MYSKFLFLSIFLVIFLFPSVVYGSSNQALEEGINQYYQKNWELAKASFEEALLQDPEDSLTLSFYYSCFLWTDSMRLGVTQAEEEYVKNPDKIESLVKLAFSYYAMGQIDSMMLGEAKNEFKEILTLDDNVAVAHTGTGMIYNDKRMTPRAKVEFEKALELDPNDVMALELLGVIIMLDDANPGDSINYFKKITEIVPNYPDAYFYLGSAYYKLKEYETAITYLQKALELDPMGIGKGYFATVFIGDSYMELEKYDEAIKAYEKALEFNPKNIAAQLKLEKAKELIKE